MRTEDDIKYANMQRKAMAKCVSVEQMYKKYGFATPTFSFSNDEMPYDLPLAERRTKDSEDWINEFTGVINYDKKYVDLEKYLKEMLRNPHRFEETDPKKIFEMRTEKILSSLKDLGFKQSYFESHSGNKYITAVHPFSDAIYNICQVDKNGKPNGIDAHYLYVEECLRNKRFDEVLKKEKLRDNQYDWFDKNRPYVNDFKYESTIPYVLREKRIFVGWKLHWDDKAGKKVQLELTDFNGKETVETYTSEGKYKKVPYNCKTGYPAKVNDPKTWSTFKEACEGIRKYGLDGIGIILGKFKVVGIDIDHCIDKDGNLSEASKEAISLINGYTEYSPSGDGIHIICFADMDSEKYKNKNEDTGFEAYGNGRFFTLSGHVIDGKIKMSSQAQNQDNFNTVLDKYLHRRHSESTVDRSRLGNQSKRLEKKQGFRKTILCEHDEAIENSLGFSDSDIIDKCMKQGERTQKIKQLSYNPFEKIYFQGDISDYPSGFHPEGDPSLADYMLCSQILYYTTSKAQCERLMRNSMIRRDKYDRVSGGTTYLYDLVERVDSQKKSRYTGKVNKNDNKTSKQKNDMEME